jgi:hypothetical protein
MATRTFVESRKSLEKQIEAYSGRCINACLTGARINGARLMKFNQALQHYCLASYDYGERLKTVWQKEKHDRVNHTDPCHQLTSRIEQSLLDLRTALDDCQKGIDVIADFEKQNDLLVNKAPNSAVMDQVRELDQTVMNIREGILHRPALRFMATVYGGFSSHYGMRKHFAYDQFKDRNFAALKALFMEKEALTIMGQLTLSAMAHVETSLKHLSQAQSDA